MVTRKQWNDYLFGSFAMDILKTITRLFLKMSWSRCSHYFTIYSLNPVCKKTAYMIFCTTANYRLLERTGAEGIVIELDTLWINN